MMKAVERQRAFPKPTFIFVFSVGVCGGCSAKRGGLQFLFWQAHSLKLLILTDNYSIGSFVPEQKEATISCKIKENRFTMNPWWRDGSHPSEPFITFSLWCYIVEGLHGYSKVYHSRGKVLCKQKATLRYYPTTLLLVYTHFCTWCKFKYITIKWTQLIPKKKKRSKPCVVLYVVILYAMNHPFIVDIE